ncbi:hypothetical protein LVJ94_51125 [Pendulispora rubella]|uniref:Uncharacterized protein n=1 Tax=Pendulispora rubella TaxID=2741070 RepID=A0ABZ2L326_9BACT
MSELPPLPEDVRDLLARAEAPEPPSGLEDRIWSQVSTGFGVPDGGAPNSPPPPPSALHAALGKWGVLSTIAALAVGGAGGAIVRGAIDAPAAPANVASAVVVPEPPVTSAPTAASPVSESPAAPTNREDAGPPPIVAKPASGPKPARRDVDLAEEQSLLETARSAILRRDPVLALAPLREHAQRFPRGHLIEERDGLWVQALANAGETAAARTKAAEFRRRYPQSLLLPAVEAAVEHTE